MDDVRTLFLATATVVRDLASSREARDRWDEPSALADMTVGGLVAHVARSVLLVERYLDADVRDGQPVGAGRYYAVLDGLTEHQSDLNVGVRERALKEAEPGHAEVLARIEATLDRLRERLPAEPADRTMPVFGQVMVLDEYLRTRLVEMTVHLDDLALSLGADAAALSDAAYRCAIDAMVDSAIERHGALGVIRALARRERDSVDALRVF